MGGTTLCAASLCPLMCGRASDRPVPMVICRGCLVLRLNRRCPTSTLPESGCQSLSAELRNCGDQFIGSLDNLCEPLTPVPFSSPVLWCRAPSASGAVFGMQQGDGTSVTQDRGEQSSRSRSWGPAGLLLSGLHAGGCRRGDACR
jgi:hypothetical protein